jgi:hypothetical protein
MTSEVEGGGTTMSKLSWVPLGRRAGQTSNLCFFLRPPPHGWRGGIKLCFFLMCKVPQDLAHRNKKRYLLSARKGVF